MPDTRRVLILCTGNSCRSQIAEALWNDLAEGRWRASSAGSAPTGYVHPLAIAVMNEIGIDIAQNTSKHLDALSGDDFDLVVTVCDNAKASCPVLPGAPRTIHWPFADPAQATGSEQERLAIFRKCRDELRSVIQAYLSENQKNE